MEHAIRLSLESVRPSLYLDKQHPDRRLRRDSVCQHRRHVDKGAWPGVDFILSQLDFSFSVQKIENCRRRS